MTPSVRRSIRQLFPNYTEEEIISCLTHCGGGLGHARSAFLYISMLHCADGDISRLSRLVDWAVQSRDSFDQYISRFSDWHAIVGHYASASDYLRFFSAILQSVARPLSEYRCGGTTSHYTLCLTNTGTAPSFPADLYLVPIIDYGVYISTDDESQLAPKTSDIVDWCDGEIVSMETAPDRILYHVDRIFEHDCRFQEDDLS